MAVFDLEAEARRISAIIPEEGWKRDHMEAMMVLDVEGYLDSICEFFRRLQRFDESNHFRACDPNYTEFEANDAIVRQALAQFMQWADRGLELVSVAKARGFSVEFAEQLDDYRAAAQDMLAETPRCLCDPAFENCLREAQDDIEAGRIEDLGD